MKRATLGVLLGLGLVTATAAVAEQGAEMFTQRPTPTAPAPAVAVGSELIVVPTSLGDKGQMLTVVAPRQQVLCVYHIDLTGKITLKSARNIQWDLKVTNFNNEHPYPQEIRSLSDPR